MPEAITEKRTYQAKAVMVFLLHQLLATWVVILAVRMLINFASSMSFWGMSPGTKSYQLLTSAPYFPLQVLASLCVGWFISKRFRQRSMLWVWVLPAVLLYISFSAIPTLTPHVTPWSLQSGRGQSRIAHYFGTGCRPENYCFDQILITLPFYVSCAYAIGALLARMRRNETSGT